MSDSSLRRVIIAAVVLAFVVGGFPLPIKAAAQDTTGPGKTVNLELIVDASGSMAAPTDTGVLRIDAAKTVLREVIAQIPQEPGVNVGFRVYGHRGDNTDFGRAESCVSSDLLVPMQGVDPAALTAQVDALQPIGWTPLGYALQQAANDFTQPASENVVNAIIMVTDGLETCDADPATIAGQLKASPASIVTHVIGFGTTPDEQAILNAITQASGGQLLGSNNAGQLMSSLFTILEELEVVEESGTGESRESPLAIGRTGRVADYDVSVVSAIASNEESGTTGGRDFTVRIAVTYQGDRAGTPGQDLEFGAYGDLGIGYNSGEDRCKDFLGGPSYDTLFTGGSAEFYVCWTVAPADLASLTMYAQPFNVNSDERVWFALNREQTNSAPAPDQSEQPAAVTVDLAAVDIRYETNTITIPANTDVTLNFYNEGVLQHSFVVDGTAIDSGQLSPGDTVQLTLNLPPGTYTFSCSVPGHKEAGMVGTIIAQ